MWPRDGSVLSHEHQPSQLSRPAIQEDPMASSPATVPGTLAVFRRRNFRLLWTAQLISTAGSSLTEVAAALLVYRMTGSALSVALVLAATVAPSLVVGVFAGVVVDRYDRRRVMLVADLVRAGLALAIPLLLPFGIAWLFLLVLLSSTAAQFFEPAQAGLLPDAAEPEELAAANAFMSVSVLTATSLGFAAAGLIAGQLPIAWAFYLDALTFVASAACLAGIRIVPLPAAAAVAVRTVLGDLRAGVGHIARTPILVSLFVVAVPTFLAFSFGNTLLLPFTQQALDTGEFEYGLLESINVVAAIAASLVVVRLAGRLREGPWLVGSFVAMGVVALIFSQVSGLPAAFALFAMLGALTAPNAVARQLVLQRHTPRELMGRVSGALFVCRNVLFLLGMAVAGVLADRLDVRLLYSALGLLLLGTGLLTLVLPGLGRPLEGPCWAPIRRRRSPGTAMSDSVATSD
jgi:MFS family permease